MSSSSKADVIVAENVEPVEVTTSHPLDSSDTPNDPPQTTSDILIPAENVVPVQMMETFDSQNHYSTTTNEAQDSHRIILTAMMVVVSLCMVVFMGGTVFSCKAFVEEASYDSYTDEVHNARFVYGYRGFTDNGECLSWDVHDQWNEYWYQRLENLFWIGVTGFAMAVIALLISSVSCYQEYSHRESADTAVSSTLRRLIWVLFFGFGILSMITLLGKCSNLPPLGEGDLGCDLHVWGTLAMVASVCSCLMGCILTCCRPCCPCLVKPS